MFKPPPLVVLALLSGALTGCGRGSSDKKKIVLTGASTIAPLATEIGKRFEELHPGVRVDVQTGGSSRGVNDLLQGLNDIAMVSRPLNDDEKDLHAVPIASDGVCIILHDSNPVKTLSADQVVAIYTKKITNWNEVGGKDAPITVVNKAEGRSTLQLFCEYFKLKNTEITADTVIGDNEQGIKQVGSAPNAIGYVSIGTAEYDRDHGTPIKLLPLKGVEPTTENVANGTFPLSRPLNLVTKTAPEGVYKEFIEFAASAKVDDLVKGQSFVPLSADRLLVWSLRTCAAISAAILLLIVLFLIAESLPVLRHVGVTRFFTDADWHPADNLYNLTPMLWGTLYAMTGAVLIATPLGVLSAVFCHYYAPPAIGRIYRRLIELLAGIPSVVYGFWGLVTLVPLISEGLHRPPGTSLLAGIAILTIMILPTIALMADAALAAVPAQYLRGAAALGLSRWATVRGVVFPAAKSGLFTGVILETGRAIGETMAVLMVCGNVVKTPRSVFDPIRTLTANIALEMSFALGDHRSALFVSGLLLMVIIIVLAVAAELLGKERAHG